MWIRMEILSVAIVVLVILVIMAIWEVISSSRRKKMFAEAVDKMIERDREQWAAFPRVQGLLDTYISIIAANGPDSTVAKKFRFAAESDPLLGAEEQAATHIFNRMANIIDTTWHAHK
jgi:hypothetical protein